VAAGIIQSALVFDDNSVTISHEVYTNVNDNINSYTDNNA
jgi:hypothetical protein